MTDIRPRRTAPAVLVCAALLTTACGGDAAVDETADQQPSASTTTSSSSSAATTSTSSSPPAATGTAVTTADSEFGVMLFDTGPGHLPVRQGDRRRPACYDECAADWPPVLTDGTPQAAGQVRGDLLGTAPRSDGTTQVTYGGHPLYFYAHEGPGEVLCHDVDEYGGTWLVVTPEGTPAPA